MCELPDILRVQVRNEPEKQGRSQRADPKQDVPSIQTTHRIVLLLLEPHPQSQMDISRPAPEAPISRVSVQLVVRVVRPRLAQPVLHIVEVARVPVLLSEDIERLHEQGQVQAPAAQLPERLLCVEIRPGADRPVPDLRPAFRRAVHEGVAPSDVVD